MQEHSRTVGEARAGCGLGSALKPACTLASRAPDTGGSAFLANLHGSAAMHAADRAKVRGSLDWVLHVYLVCISCAGGSAFLAHL